MKTASAIDTARVELLLAELRLPAVKLVWADLATQADKEGWPAARFLAALAEHEMAERARRRIERHLAEARLPPGKTLESFDFDAVPVVSKAQVMALAAGDSWLEKGANLIMFGPPGGGKSHLAAALGFALVENGWRVLFTRTTDLVQRLQIARRELSLESAALHQRVRRSRWIERLCRAPISSASRDSAYPARGSTHSRRVQGAHLALAATRGNHATRGGASAARNCARGIALLGWPRVGAANRSSPLIGRCPARIVAQSISASGGHDGEFLYE